MFCSQAQAGEPPQTVEFNMKEIITQLDVFVHQNWPVKRLKQLGCKRITIGGFAHLKQFDVRKKNCHAA